jgi:hypothetical protein
MSWGGVKAGLTGMGSALVVSCAIAMTAGHASAKSTYASPYGYDRTWNAALRLVRVDNGWKVTEKDDQNGYLLFDYKQPETGKSYPGTLELVRGKDDESPVSVLVQLPAMPQYHEQVLIDKLAQKMRREYGDAPVHARPTPVVPDGGTPEGGAAPDGG